MTREQFIAEYRHVLMGVMTDNIERGRDPVALGLWLRMAYPKLDAALGAAFDAAIEKTKTPQPPRKDGAK